MCCLRVRAFNAYHSVHGSIADREQPQESMSQTKKQVGIVRQFASNPFAPKTGNVLKIKLAYMNSLLKAYEHLGIQEALDKTRHSPPLTGRGIQIMNEYKKARRARFNWDMSLKIECARVERASVEREWEKLAVMNGTRIILTMSQA